MRSPSSHNDLLDLPLAGQAGLAFTTVGAVLELKKAFLPIGIDIVGDRGSSSGDRLLEHLAERDVELGEFGASERVRATPWPDPGAKQALIGVDVAHSVQQGLVEQQGLDRRSALVKEPGKVFYADG